MERGLARLAERVADHQVHVVVGGRSAARYRLPARSHVHWFASLSEMAGFTKGLLAAAPSQIQDRISKTTWNRFA
jgi:hypothetical protein